jgi:hypothetical protein
MPVHRVAAGRKSRNPPAPRPASGPARWAPRANSARRPNPRSRRRGTGRCRTRRSCRWRSTAPRIARRVGHRRRHPVPRRAALVMVSMVVKVLEATITSVRAGRAPSACRDMRAVHVRDVMQPRPVVIGRQRQRRHGAGPRSEPPMPILTTSVIGPRPPRDRARRGRPSAKSSIRARVSPARRASRRPRRPSPARPSAQRGVQHRPALGLVDLRAREHRLAPRGHIRRLGQREQPAIASASMFVLE